MGTLYLGSQEICPIINVGEPTGTIDITENGTVDVKDYASANVNVIGIPREISNGIYRVSTSSHSFTLPDDVTTIAQHALHYSFYSSGLTSVNLNNVAKIEKEGLKYAFTLSSNLSSINMNKVNSLDESAMDNAFRRCSSLTSLSFPALKSTSFGSYTNQFNSMLSGVTDCTVHFPSNLQSVIGSWADVTAGFGGTNTTVLFDLPATT